MATTQDPVKPEELTNSSNPAPKLSLNRNSGGSQGAINIFKYPSDLGKKDLRHYVLFEINVRGKSEFNKDNRQFEVKRDPDSANLSQEQLSTATTVASGIAGAVAGFAVAKGLYEKISKSGGSTKGTIVGVAGAAAGGIGAAALVNSSSLLKPDTTHRISDAIALHINEPPSVKYNMNYANKDLGTLAGLLSGGAFDSQGAFKGAGEAAAAMGASLAKLPGMFGATDVKSLLSASSKTSLNPFKEVIFEAVDFRKFAFRYKFLPRNQAETKEIEDIIKLFKFHMHPEMSAGKLFFIYPSEFNISYYFDGKENSYFHKFAPCVLESMEVSYGGEQFSAFRDGAPTEVNLSLVFSETEILTKKMINKGY